MREKSTLPARLRLPALIVALLVGAAPSRAQTPVATLEAVRTEVSPGDVITIVRTTGDPVTGRLQRFGDTDLDIGADAPRAPGAGRRIRDVTIPLGDIRSLERRRDSARNGALIGAGVGAGIGLVQFAWAAAVDSNEIDEWGPAYLAIGGMLTGLGALAGWAIDRAHSKPHIRFDAPGTRAITIRAVPLRSRGPGLAIVVSFQASRRKAVTRVSDRAGQWACLSCAPTGAVAGPLRSAPPNAGAARPAAPSTRSARQRE